MAFLGSTIRAEDLPQSSGDFEPLPAGLYTVSIASAELTPTKDGSGQYIKLKLNIVAPTHQGRTIFSNLNIRNQSAKAEEIGRQQLGSILRAINLAAIEDTDQLIGGVMDVKVTVKAATDQYQAGNEVKGYYAPPSAKAPVIAQMNPPKAHGLSAGAHNTQPAAPAQAATPATRPW